MTDEKQISYDHHIMENDSIKARKITRFLEDGVVIAKVYHCVVVSPGDSTDGHDDRTVELAKTLHTDKVVDDYKAGKEYLY